MIKIADNKGASVAGMTEYGLFGFAQSDNAEQVVLMLELCGGDWNAWFVHFFGGETRMPQYRALNELGETPMTEFLRP